LCLRYARGAGRAVASSLARCLAVASLAELALRYDGRLRPSATISKNFSVSAIFKRGVGAISVAMGHLRSILPGIPVSVQPPPDLPGCVLGFRRKGRDLKGAGDLVLTSLFSVARDGELPGSFADSFFVPATAGTNRPTLGHFLPRQFHPLRNQLVPFQRRQFRPVKVLGNLPPCRGQTGNRPGNNAHPCTRTLENVRYGIGWHDETDMAKQLRAPRIVVCYQTWENLLCMSRLA